MRIFIICVATFVTVVGTLVCLYGFKGKAKDSRRRSAPSRRVEVPSAPTGEAHELRLRGVLKNSEQGTVKLPDHVVLLLTLENLSKVPVLFRERNPEVEFDFEVKNSQGNNLPLKHSVAQLKADKDVFGALLISLKPGEQRKYEVDLNRVVDEITPDTYRITVSRHDLYLMDESEDSISVQADPVKVVVLDATK